MTNHESKERRLEGFLSYLQNPTIFPHWDAITIRYKKNNTSHTSVLSKDQFEVHRDDKGLFLENPLSDESKLYIEYLLEISLNLKGQDYIIA